MKNAISSHVMIMALIITSALSCRGQEPEGRRAEKEGISLSVSDINPNGGSSDTSRIEVNLDPKLCPYKDELPDYIYNLLFCDNAEMFRREGEAASRYPFNVLQEEIPNSVKLKEMLEDRELPSRIRMLAANRLRTAKVKVRNQIILGIIIEIPQKRGLDVLAVFEDGSARYINQAGGVVILESGDDFYDQLVKELFQTGKVLLRDLKAQTAPRLSFPKDDNARITLLVSDGYYMKQATRSDLFEGPKTGEVLTAGVQILKIIVEQEGLSQDE